MQMCLTVFFIVANLIFAGSQELGSDCHMNGSLLGKCIDFFECHRAMEEFYSRGIYPKVCRSDQNIHIVCCLPDLPLPSNEGSKSPPEQTSVRDNKCTQYAEYVYEDFVDTKSRLTIRKNQCHSINYPPLQHITEAGSLEFPHLALLGHQKQNAKIDWLHAGSLVSSRYVLTSTKILDGPITIPTVIKVRLGQLNISTSTALPSDYDIEKSIIHPLHNKKTLYNDIALLKLATQAILTPYVRPICLPSTDIELDSFIARGLSTVIGLTWVRKTLLKQKVHSDYKLELCACSKLYVNNWAGVLFPHGLRSTQMCITNRVLTCDAGSPLQVYHENTTCSFIQIGIASYTPCGDYLPAVYTRVFDYADWIESVIWAAGEDF